MTKKSYVPVDLHVHTPASSCYNRTEDTVDNDYIKDMGFFNTSDLYISVVDDEADDSKRSAKKKNARNITLAIVKEYNI